MLNPKYVLLIPLFLTTFYSGFSARILPFEKPLVGICFLLIFFFALALGLKHIRTKPSIPIWCGMVVIHSALLFFPLIDFDTIRSGWVLSSFVTYCSVAAFTVLALKLSEEGHEHLLKAYLAAQLIAMFCAPLAMVLMQANRFEPPGFLLMAAALIWFARSKSLMPILALIIVFGFSLASQVRVNFIIIVGFGLVLTFSRLSRPELRICLPLLCIGLLVLLIPMIPTWPNGEIPGARRLAKLSTLEGFHTEVILRRGLEVKSAWQALSLASPMELIFGHGHGATYPARLLLLDLNANHRSIDWRFTETSEAFVLHFGPLRLLYRTGILGLILFLAPLLYASAIGVMRLFHPLHRNAHNHRMSFWTDVCALASVMWLAKFALAPAETDFGFAVTLGSCIALHLRARAVLR